MGKYVNRIILLVILILVLLFGGWLLMKKASPSLSLERTTKIDRTPEEITRIHQIKQWEFLAANTEEMVDTTRKSFWGDDVLCRIYTGTLRLGIDMEQAPADWFTAKDSTAILRLPPVTLLDERFIDEARTRSFYENGDWDATAKEALYQKAAAQMKRRILTRENMATAETNGRETFTKIFQALGYRHVGISFEK